MVACSGLYQVLAEHALELHVEWPLGCRRNENVKRLLPDRLRQFEHRLTEQMIADVAAHHWIVAVEAGGHRQPYRLDATAGEDDVACRDVERLAAAAVPDGHRTHLARLDIEADGLGVGGQRQGGTVLDAAKLWVAQQA